MRISNADAQRIIKPFAIDGKNWLFCNTENGARSSAIIYFIVETCKANKINPFEYLRYILEHIHEYRHNNEELKKFLPFTIDQKLLRDG